MVLLQTWFSHAMMTKRKICCCKKLNCAMRKVYPLYSLFTALCDHIWSQYVGNILMHCYSVFVILLLTDSSVDPFTYRTGYTDVADWIYMIRI
jgi:hypothetical protein